jgi:HK97 family phage prohead protease
MSTITREKRFSGARSKPTIKSREDGSRYLEGYAAVFYNPADPQGTEYELYPGYVERIMPGAFDRAIREKQDVRGLFNHDVNNLLGRTTSGTLSLSIDAVGLRYEIGLPETTVGKDVAISCERGDLSGSSFSFSNATPVWREVGPTLYREVEDLNLYDVGPVTFPAYSGTTTGLRSDDGENLEVIKREADQFRAAQKPAKSRSVEIRAREIEVRMKLAELAQ